MSEAVPDLATWLLEQLAVDERENSTAGEPGSWCDRSAGTHYEYERIAAEVDTKRRIIDLHRAEPGQHPDFCGHDLHELPCPTQRLLALPYADRPGYRDEWRP